MRNLFGGSIADWTFGSATVSGTADLAQLTGGVPVTMWSQQVGGVQYTDLLDMDGNAITAVMSSTGDPNSAAGQIPQFYGPDGVRVMWAQAGTGPRALIRTTSDEAVPVILPPLSVPGPVSPAVGKARLYNDTLATWQIVAVRASVGAAPTSPVVVDINRNGASIFSMLSNRPAITTGAHTSGRVAPTDVVTVAPGDYLTADVDEGAGAADLVVQILAERAAA